MAEMVGLQEKEALLVVVAIASRNTVAELECTIIIEEWGLAIEGPVVDPEGLPDLVNDTVPQRIKAGKFAL